MILPYATEIIRQTSKLALSSGNDDARTKPCGRSSCRSPCVLRLRTPDFGTRLKASSGCSIRGRRGRVHSSASMSKSVRAALHRLRSLCCEHGGQYSGAPADRRTTADIVATGVSYENDGHQEHQHSRLDGDRGCAWLVDSMRDMVDQAFAPVTEAVDRLETTLTQPQEIIRRMDDELNQEAICLEAGTKNADAIAEMCGTRWRLYRMQRYKQSRA